MPTPDDLAGGIVDGDKLVLNNAGLTADVPGDVVYDGTQVCFRDAAGPVELRNAPQNRVIRDTIVPTDHFLIQRKMVVPDNTKITIADSATLVVLD